MIAAELTVQDAHYRLIDNVYPTSSYVTVASEYRLTMSSVACDTSRYLGSTRGAAWFPDFPSSRPRAVTRLMFRAPDINMSFKGCGEKVRMLRVALPQRRFERLTGHGKHWTLAELEAGISLGATCPAIAPIMQRIAAEVTNPGFASITLIDGLATTAIVEVMRALRKSLDVLNANEVLQTKHLRIIKDRVADFSEPPPSVATLAALCGVSERHILRLFKKQTGITLISYVREARLEHARRLLGETTLSLKEVAFQLGFASQSSFTEAFRRETNMTPAEYRRSCHRQYVVPPRNEA